MLVDPLLGLSDSLLRSVLTVKLTPFLCLKLIESFSETKSDDATFGSKIILISFAVSLIGFFYTEY